MTSTSMLYLLMASSDQPPYLLAPLPSPVYLKVVPLSSSVLVFTPSSSLAPSSPLSFHAAQTSASTYCTHSHKVLTIGGCNMSFDLIYGTFLGYPTHNELGSFGRKEERIRFPVGLFVYLSVCLFVCLFVCDNYCRTKCRFCDCIVEPSNL